MRITHCLILSFFITISFFCLFFFSRLFLFESEEGKGRDDTMAAWQEEMKKESDIFFSPSRGNVVFGSAFHGWAFRWVMTDQGPRVKEKTKEKERENSTPSLFLLLFFLLLFFLVSFRFLLRLSMSPTHFPLDHLFSLPQPRPIRIDVLGEVGGGGEGSTSSVVGRLCV